MLTEKLMRLTVAGGSEWVMVLLIALSMLSLAVIAERLLFFAAAAAKLDELDAQLTPLLAGKGQNERVRALVQKAKDPTLLSALGEEKDDPDASEKLVASVLGRERLRLEKRLGFLGTLGSNAPFIGLFGTVLGIIRAFHDLSLDSKGGSSAVMSGISEALVATAIGLFVAIPAVMAYNYFQREVDHVLGTTESLAQSILAGRVLSGAATAETSAAKGAAKTASKTASKPEGKGEKLAAEES